MVFIQGLGEAGELGAVEFLGLGKVAGVAEGDHGVGAGDALREGELPCSGSFSLVQT